MSTDYLASIVCVVNKKEDVNLNVFNIITGTNESKTVIKHILCNCKSNFEGRKKVENRLKINVDVNVKSEKLRFQKRLYLESYCMHLWEWQIFCTYY